MAFIGVSSPVKSTDNGVGVQDGLLRSRALFT